MKRYRLWTCRYRRRSSHCSMTSQQRLQLTLVFITHDLRVAAQICNRVVLLQFGRVIEHGLMADVFENPQHEYTRALLQAAPGRGFAFGKFGCN